jgi:hypothetical protein
VTKQKGAVLAETEREKKTVVTTLKECLGNQKEVSEEQR